jgi:hypothetical protein
MKKSMITVKEATKIGFSMMDKKFHSIRLCQVVRNLTGRAFLMDGTIMRRLRAIRAEEPDKYNYEINNYLEGIYEKKVSSN